MLRRAQLGALQAHLSSCSEAGLHAQQELDDARQQTRALESSRDQAFDRARHWESKTREAESRIQEIAHQVEARNEKVKVRS